MEKKDIINGSLPKDRNNTNIGYLRIKPKTSEDYINVMAERTFYDFEKINKYIDKGIDELLESFGKLYRELGLESTKQFFGEEFKQTILEYIKIKDTKDKFFGHTEQRIISCLDVVNCKDMDKIEIYTERPCCPMCVLILIGFKCAHTNIGLKVIDSDLNYNVYIFFIQILAKYTNLNILNMTDIFNRKYPLTEVGRSEYGRYSKITAKTRSFLMGSNISTNIQGLFNYEYSIGLNNNNKNTYRFDSRSTDKLPVIVYDMCKIFDDLKYQKFNNLIITSKLQYQLDKLIVEQNSLEENIKKLDKMMKIMVLLNSIHKIQEMMPGISEELEEYYNSYESEYNQTLDYYASTKNKEDLDKLATLFGTNKKEKIRSMLNEIKKELEKNKLSKANDDLQYIIYSLKNKEQEEKTKLRLLEDKKSSTEENENSTEENEILLAKNKMLLEKKEILLEKNKTLLAENKNLEQSRKNINLEITKILNLNLI